MREVAATDEHAPGQVPEYVSHPLVSPAEFTSELIAPFEKKIRATLPRVWGEDEPAAAEA